jgi:membrane fusion protein, copper/silver efflux system
MNKPHVKSILAVAIVIAAIVLVRVFWTSVGVHSGDISHQHDGTTMYQCPMHPQIVQDKPGQCPICNMELQPIKKTKEPAAVSGDKNILFYRHPMNPSIHSPVPAKDDMGMPFIPVYESGGESAIAGRAQVNVNLNKQQLIGVKTHVVKYQDIIKKIYAAGRIAYDPELYRTQEEFISAVKAFESIKSSPLENAALRQEELLKALGLRLRLLGMTPNEIESLKSSETADRNLLMVQEGEGNEPWLYADIYESEIPHVRAGQKILASWPNNDREFYGEIRSIDPTIDPNTRSAKIRAKLSDTGGLLRPGMYLNVVIELNLGKELAVPKSAVLDTGKRKLVYVVSGNDQFTPRQIMTSVSGEQVIAVTNGLSEGESVVVSGNFMVDAESQLQGSEGGQTFYSGQEVAEDKDK